MGGGAVFKTLLFPYLVFFHWTFPIKKIPEPWQLTSAEKCRGLVYSLASLLCCQDWWRRYLCKLAPFCSKDIFCPLIERANLARADKKYCSLSPYGVSCFTTRDSSRIKISWPKFSHPYFPAEHNIQYNSKQSSCTRAGNTNWGGGLGTIYPLIKIACFVKKVNIFNIKRSWY